MAHPALRTALFYGPVVEAWTCTPRYQGNDDWAWRPALLVRYADGRGNIFLRDGTKVFVSGDGGAHPPFESSTLADYRSPHFWTSTKFI